MRYASNVSSGVTRMLSGCTDFDPQQHGMTTDEERAAAKLPQVGWRKGGVDGKTALQSRHAVSTETQLLRRALRNAAHSPSDNHVACLLPTRQQHVASFQVPHKVALAMWHAARAVAQRASARRASQRWPQAVWRRRL